MASEWQILQFQGSSRGHCRTPLWFLEENQPEAPKKQELAKVEWPLCRLVKYECRCRVSKQKTHDSKVGRHDHE